MPGAAERDRITTEGVTYRTTTGFNIAAFVVVAILVALYATWW
jgi:SSS family solute:Na+ symporter